MPKLVIDFDVEENWPEFGRLPNGKQVRLVDVNGLVKSGKLDQTEARNIVVALPDGVGRPWIDDGHYVNDDGSLFGVPTLKGDPMTRDELAGLGYTDDELEALRAKFFGKPAPGSPRLASDARPTIDLEVYRKRVFDAVYRRLFEG